MVNKNVFFGFLLLGIVVVAFSCSKDDVVIPITPPVVVKPISFVEEFDNTGDLTAKGWAFKNNTAPVGQSGWRQGRYEAATGVQYKFLAPVSTYGFPAFSASATPNDFISCDVTAGNDAVSGFANYSAWLISPELPLKNGDQITFYTRAVLDANYSVYLKDRVQVRANYTDGSADVGKTPTSVGNFTKVLLDINNTYGNNDPSGYPMVWTKYTYTFTGVPGGGVAKGRFAFRYFAEDAGVYGGTAGENYPGCVGIDKLEYIHN